MEDADAETGASSCLLFQLKVDETSQQFEFLSNNYSSLFYYMVVFKRLGCLHEVPLEMFMILLG